MDEKEKNQGKILLMLLPFWTPLLPPMGISCLKSHLQAHGYPVKAVDASAHPDFKQLYEDYFNVLRKAVPEKKQGNFYSIGHDVLRNHMTAFMKNNDKNRYMELLKLLVYNTFYEEISSEELHRLHEIMGRFYTRLEEYLLGLLEGEKPAVLGLSVNSGTLSASMFAAKFTRERFPRIKIVMGGGVFADQLDAGSPNFKSFLEETSGYIDNIIIGEGETLFVKLLKGELPDSQKVFTLNDIDWEILDLDKAGTPDFSDFDLSAYPNLGAYTSRSCPFQCSFCSETVQWGKYRRKTARRIVEELTGQYKTYGHQLFFMTDSLLNPVITDLAGEFIRSDTSIYWDACIRADKNVCDTRNTLLWRKGGFYRARLGLESGSPRILDKMGKKITPGQIKEALKSLAYAGIKTSTLWVIGHPGETEEDFRQTLDLVEEMKDYIYDVEGTPFWYHLTGQSNSEEWLGEKSVLLYPEWAGDMLVTRTWIIDCEPGREEIYRRMHRFMAMLKRLGIPNPYSMLEIYEADQRWKKLHKNAVPAQAEFARAGYIDENKKIKELNFIASEIQENGDFGF